MLSGKGFQNVYNLSGGIKAWNNEIAVGPQDLGLHLFSGKESAEETIVVGFGLEQGLREFYLDMANRVTSAEAKSLFTKLADIEILHQKHLFKLYQDITGTTASMEDFATNTVQPAMEGGLSTEEYLNLYNPNLESEQDILSLALSIEAQALDLYQRAANNDPDAGSRKVLQQIANEERAHMDRLANHLDKL
jgi:sulfur-carrier protein adenylyltransferase/sulfurtransferase